MFFYILQVVAAVITIVCFIRKCAKRLAKRKKKG